MANVPFLRLAYLYVGSADVQRDVEYYRDRLGGEVVWDATGFETRVAAVRLGPGPLILLAAHRTAPSVMPIFEVDDLAKARAALEARGWSVTGEPFEVPDGPAVRFDDPSGNAYAILQITRPDAMLRDHE